MPYSSQGGQMTGQCGQAPVPVNHSPQRGNVKERQINATSGPTCIDSLPNVNPQLSSANKSAQWRSLEGNRQKDALYQNVYRKKNRARDLMRHARFRAMKRGLPFDLDHYLNELQQRIDIGLCEISGLPFNLDGGRTWDSPSFDRIDPKGGYVYSNIRVVVHAVNSAMGDWGEVKMLEIARAIMARRLNSSNTLSEQLGQNLMRRLGTSGSLEYGLTWKRTVTESGHVIYQQRASGRRISGSGCTGWPTPCQQDGPNGGPGQGQDRLPGAAMLAGWPTTAARDWRDGRSNQHGKNARPAERGSATGGLAIPGPQRTGRGLCGPGEGPCTVAEWASDQSGGSGGISGLEQSPVEQMGIPRQSREPRVPGPWSPYSLIPCRDGKTRRTKPGIQPLANGIPSRVAKLRAIGNAIVPQVAAEFITAYMETVGILPY